MNLKKGLKVFILSFIALVFECFCFIMSMMLSDSGTPEARQLSASVGYIIMTVGALTVGVGTIYPLGTVVAAITKNERMGELFILVFGGFFLVLGIFSFICQ